MGGFVCIIIFLFSSTCVRNVHLFLLGKALTACKSCRLQLAGFPLKLIVQSLQLFASNLQYSLVWHRILLFQLLPKSKSLKDSDLDFLEARKSESTLFTVSPESVGLWLPLRRSWTLPVSLNFSKIFLKHCSDGFVLGLLGRIFVMKLRLSCVTPMSSLKFKTIHFLSSSENPPIVENMILN